MEGIPRSFILEILKVAGRPDGGMFAWLTLPGGCSTLRLFEDAKRGGVAILPGLPFCTDGAGDRTVRLNFSNADEEAIEEGCTAPPGRSRSRWSPRHDTRSPIASLI